MFGNFVSAPRTPIGDILSLSSSAVSTQSARALSTRPYQQSYTPTNTTILKSSITGKGLYDTGDFCVVRDCADHPRATKTVDQYDSGTAVYPDLEKLCVLWNSSCSGNLTFARDKFFVNTTEALRANECFQKPPTEASEPNGLKDCYSIESPKRLLQFGQAKEWMRSPKCPSEKAVWAINARACHWPRNLAAWRRPGCSLLLCKVPSYS